jgi:hypothetical protein
LCPCQGNKNIVLVFGSYTNQMYILWIFELYMCVIMSSFLLSCLTIYLERKVMHRQCKPCMFVLHFFISVYGICYVATYIYALLFSSCIHHHHCRFCISGEEFQMILFSVFLPSFQRELGVHPCHT